MDEDDWKNAVEVQRQREAAELERRYVSQDLAAAAAQSAVAPGTAGEANSV